MNSVEARALSFRHGDGPLVLRGLDFRVEAGEFVCLLGHSGGGKTTLLRLAAGLERPTSGELLVGGAPVAGPGTDRGMVFQEHSLFPWLTARANVAFGVRQAFRRLSRREAEARAVHFLERAGLAGGLDLYPHQMSGGMRQRAAVARMLAMDARVWLLDEPFSALDPTMRLTLQTLVRKLWAEGEPRKTVLFVTHNVDEALRLADRILFLGGGRIAGDLRAATGEDTDSDEARRFALRTELARLYREHAAGRDVA
ncbi:MAG: ABC transporter ATP-binding protein [Fretibacterium sp.]|nr:ABC transporter ATP-binding protein [Fretibacterium sp.]